MMDPFVEYLKSAKELANNINSSSNAPVHVVMGNESCDLDSMISALALAYFIHQQTLHKQANYSTTVMPILNIRMEELALRPENYYVLTKVGINKNLLVFRNQVDLQELHNRGLLKLSLVDHHVLQSMDQFLAASVIEIFDHRPVDPNATWNENKVKIVIEQVGCCSTLVANKILKEEPNILSNTLATLLYDVITFDTIAFSPEAGKVRELDIQVSTELTNRFPQRQEAKVLFDELWKAHNDVSHLTPKQLLSKDLKIVEGLPIPGLPMLVKEYFKLPNVEKEMIDFCEDKNSSTIVVIGLHVADSKAHRDIAVFNCNSDNTLAIAIATNLKKTQDLHLEEVVVDIPNVIYFTQNNVKLTRKHILPVVKETVVSYKQNG